MTQMSSAMASLDSERVARRLPRSRPLISQLSGRVPARAVRLLIVLVLVLTFALDSCGAGTSAPNAQSTPSVGSLAIATYDPGTASMTALIVGTIRGTVNSDRTACFRMAEDPPNVPMIWPAGYSASTGPLRVLDRFGKTIAVDGQHVRLPGGTADFATSRPIRGCGEAKQVTVVE